MNKIESFKVNHDTLNIGLYISRIDKDITTYDLRMKKPNMGDYLSNPSLHTIEHIIATYLRNSNFKDDIIYFGPMGCRTGFYLLARNIEHSDIISLVKSAFEYLVNFKGDIPGASKKECGNYLEHDFSAASYDSIEFLNHIQNYKVDGLHY